jgi:hypothetical protein
VREREREKSKSKSSSMKDALRARRHSLHFCAGA